jgi:hypothetical protein
MEIPVKRPFTTSAIRMRPVILLSVQWMRISRESCGSAPLTRSTASTRPQTTRPVAGLSVATSGDVRDQPKVADAASELLQAVFGKDKNPSRLVYGAASLPLGAPVELEVILEAAG